MPDKTKSSFTSDAATSITAIHAELTNQPQHRSPRHSSSKRNVYVFADLFCKYSARRPKTRTCVRPPSVSIALIQCACHKYLKRNFLRKKCRFNRMDAKGRTMTSQTWMRTHQTPMSCRSETQSEFAQNFLSHGPNRLLHFQPDLRASRNARKNLIKWVFTQSTFECPEDKRLANRAQRGRKKLSVMLPRTLRCRF